MLINLVEKSTTFARHPVAIVKTKLLLPLCRKIGKPTNYQRCGFLCKQPWNPTFVRNYRRAKHFQSKIDRGAVSVVRVLSYSRSGSHNFLCRLHYLPSCLVLKENLCPDKARDPMWLSLTPDHVTATDYMGFSMFGFHGLQQKRGEDLKYLVTPFNKLLEFPLNQDSNPFSPQDRVLFLTRNFFRMLKSRQDAVENRGKEKWTITDDAFYAAINAHHANIKKYSSLMAARPEQFHILGHELFCARPQHVFQEATKQLGIENCIWTDPEDFFVKCLDGKTAPILRNDCLWDVTTDKPILGTGGSYNPRMNPSLPRTLCGDLGQFVRKEWEEYARRLFGHRLVDLWLSDTPATYKAMSPEEYAQLLCEVR